MKQILIIDDDNELRKTLIKFLEKFDYSAFGATDGQQGLKIIEQTRIDLVICDVFMPEEDGMGFLGKLRGLESRPKIIMVSGGGNIADTSYLNIAKKLGADRILEKPFQFEQIRSYIEELLM